MNECSKTTKYKIKQWLFNIKQWHILHVTISENKKYMHSVFIINISGKKRIVGWVMVNENVCQNVADCIQHWPVVLYWQN